MSRDRCFAGPLALLGGLLLASSLYAFDATYDTNSNTIKTSSDAGGSALLPAYGSLSFKAGAGSQAVQLNQNFSDDANRIRADVTAYTLWANGAELLGNVRQFTEQTLAHNAVTINRTNMSRGSGTVGGANHRFTSGNLTLFEPMNNGLSISEVDGQRAYANMASRYQRMLILNTVDPSHPYVVDVFRVAGGKTHDYTHHGAVHFDQTSEATVPLNPMPGDYPLLEGGEVWTEPSKSGSPFSYYGFFRDVQQGVATNRSQITYLDASDLRRDLRLWMTGEEGSTIYLGVTPNPSRDDTTPASFYQHWRPSAIIRHRVTTGPLQSLYANVVEPMANGMSAIESVERVPLSGGGQEAVALHVSFTDGRSDTYLINLRNPKIAGATGGSDTIATTDNAYCLTGRVGVHVARRGAESRVWTVGARKFKYGSRTVTNPAPSYSGNIIGMTRKAAGDANDAFIVDVSIPAGATLQGRRLSVTFQGMSEMFQIDRVETINGQTHVILTTESVAPERTITGANTFEIVLSTSALTKR